MDEDALIDGWDAYVDGRANGLDRLSHQDREVIEMLHTRSWSPVPAASFATALRARLTTPTPGAPPKATTAAQPLPTATGERHRATTHNRRRVALAAAVAIALLASFGGRLVDDPAPPTVRAPLTQATTAGAASPAVVKPALADGCLMTDAPRAQVASTFIDANLMPEIVAVLPTVRSATLQTIVRREAGSVLPDGYDLTGVTGVVADAVVVGAATATFREGAWLMAVDSTRFSGGVRPVFPDETIDLLRGDVVVYPIGSLVQMSNALDDRWLEIARLVLHDVEELPGRVTDTITINTVARAAVDVDQLLRSPVELTITFGYVVGQPSPAIAATDCRPTGSLLISGLGQEPPDGAPDNRPTYGGPFVRLTPLVPPLPATPTT